MSTPGVHVQEQMGHLPPEMQHYVNQIMDRASRLSNQEYMPGLPLERRVAPENAGIRGARALAAGYGPENQIFNSARNLMSYGSAQRFPQHASQYMNPYSTHVADRIAELGNRNFREKILPALSGEFIKAGQHGSGRHQKMATRAARDIQREILGEQQSALHKGYGEAMQAFNWDQARQAQLAEMMSKLGLGQGASRIANIEALSKAGSAEREAEQFRRDLEQEELMNANRHKMERLAFLSNITHQQPYIPTTYNVSRVPRPASSMRGQDYRNLGLSTGARLLSDLMRNR